MSGSENKYKTSDPDTGDGSAPHHPDVSAPAVPTALMTVGAADHPEERAADIAAEHALSRLDRLHANGSGTHDHARRHPAPITGVEVGREGGSLESGTDGRIRALQGRGRPLPDPLRRSMETAFESPLDRVRVHTGAESADLNGRMSASAFTIGQDIFLGGDQLTSGDPHDQHVLAHEIAHTLQSGSTVHRLHLGDAPVIRRYKKTSGGPKSGSFVGEPSGCHCHIEIGSPHFKLGNNDGSRINFGQDMNQARMQRAYEAMIDLHQGKPGFADCKAYFEEMKCSAPAQEPLVGKLKKMLITWGGLAETSFSYLNEKGQHQTVDAHSPERLDAAIEAKSDLILVSNVYYGNFLDEGGYRSAKFAGLDDDKMHKETAKQYETERNQVRGSS